MPDPVAVHILEATLAKIKELEKPDQGADAYNSLDKILIREAGDHQLPLQYLHAAIRQHGDVDGPSSSSPSIPEWNDNKERTIKDIISILDDAITLALLTTTKSS